jgi:hypothetical protein
LSGSTVCANASKHVFNTSDVKKYLFLKLEYGGFEV